MATATRASADAAVAPPRTFGFSNIYILPSVDGLVLTATLATLFLIAVNYEIQLIYFTVFATGACLNAAMIMTHRNLHGLRPPTFSVEPTFAGGKASLAMRFDPSPLARTQLTVTMRERRRRFWISGRVLGRRDFHLPRGRAETVTLAIPAPSRGVHALPAVSFSTRFPLGLFRAWTIVDVAATLVVYPRPAGTDRLPQPRGAGAGAGGGQVSGADEYYGLRRYREGGPVNRIAWRPSARRDLVVIKEFVAPAAAELELDLADLAHLPDLETRLSQLALWALTADRAGIAYALVLSDRRLGPGRGERHLKACLTALATL